jgi:Spy/CpxP family protein refolding chaperone
MTKAKLILVIAFAVTLLAGGAVGFTARSTMHHSPMPHNHLPDLNLTADQKGKMDDIWSAVRDFHETQSDQRKAFQKQREDAVHAILTEEQKVKYDEVLKDYQGKMTELAKARDKTFQEAIDKTKLVLNAEQRNKYEEWLKTWHDERHPGGAAAGPQHGRAPGGAPPPVKPEEQTTATGSGT